MAVQLRNIIEKINQKSFDIATIQGVEGVLSKIPKLTYVGHGVQSICFKREDEYVVKCCLKRKNSMNCIINSKQLFINTTQELIAKGFPILSMKEVLYEDETWIVYLQPCCHVINLNMISFKFCYKVIEFVALMIEHNIRFSDIYYHNFGIHQNKLLLFDYHEMENFDSSSNFMMTNLYSMFTLLGQQLKWNVKQSRISHWDEIVSDNFGQNRFPAPVYACFEALYKRDKVAITPAIDTLLVYLRDHLKTDMKAYRFLMLDEHDDLIRLEYPSTTYEALFNFIKNNAINSLLDVPPHKVGLGLKLAQDFPNIAVTVGCKTVEETVDTRNIIQHCLTYNAHIINGAPLDLKPSIGERFDLVIYNSTILPLLQHNRICDFMKMIKCQVSCFFLMEIPVKGDQELNHVVDRQVIDEYFANVFVFRTYLHTNRIKVLRCFSVDYRNRHIKRYLFICKL